MSHAALHAQDVAALATISDRTAAWRQWSTAWQWKLLGAVQEAALWEDRRRTGWRRRTARDHADVAWRAASRDPRIEEACEQAYAAHRAATPTPAVARPKRSAAPTPRLTLYEQALRAHG